MLSDAIKEAFLDAILLTVFLPSLQNLLARIWIPWTRSLVVSDRTFPTLEGEDRKGCRW